MKRLICVAAVLTLGCYDRNQPNRPGTVPAHRHVESHDVDATTRDVYVTGMREKLAEFDKQLAIWNTQLNQASGDAQVRMRTQMGELKSKRDAFAAEIDHLAEQTNVGWIHKKGDTDRSFTELKATFARAAEVFH